MQTEEFQQLIWNMAQPLYRDMPWRRDTQPYYVLVSEIMLQQTQVDRVYPKFLQFIELFPDVQTLAKASLSEVLQAWNGLGYNRRAKFLHEAAQTIINEYDGVFPDTQKMLTTLPGVGVNTAGALIAYSFNKPAVFIETNIRTVYYNHYFAHKESVSDSLLREAVAQTIDKEHPRNWYWALMDYGAFLKRQGLGFVDKNKNYKKQPALKGSVREIRGLIIKELTKNDVSETKLRTLVPDDARFHVALTGLRHDGLVDKTDGQLHLVR